MLRRKGLLRLYRFKVDDGPIGYDLCRYGVIVPGSVPYWPCDASGVGRGRGLEALVSVCWWRFWDRSGVRLVECLVPVVWCFLGDLASFYRVLAYPVGFVLWGMLWP